ncbi:MAG: hypothetical protein F6K35_51795, partial [Okeania sp. SIO2H7]|nr:hypothetical protein [Okeania sp. SIO2H7]
HALVDYAHNPASYEAVGSFVKNWPGESVGVIGGPGDRRDEDFVTLGELSATIFDHIIIKEDDDTRGRPRGEAADLIMKGVKNTQTNTPTTIQLNETKAIELVLDNAPENGLVVILPESVSRAIDLIKARNPIWDSTASQAVPSSPSYPEDFTPPMTAPTPVVSPSPEPLIQPH